MWNVILNNFGWNFLLNVGMYAIYCVYFLNIFCQLFWMLDVTDVVVTFGLKPMDIFLADVICHIIYAMADVCCHCGRCKCHFVCMWKMKTTLNDVFIDCGRCYNHNMIWLVLLP